MSSSIPEILLASHPAFEGQSKYKCGLALQQSKRWFLVFLSPPAFSERLFSLTLLQPLSIMFTWPLTRVMALQGSPRFF